jgi:hypothetical protein
MQMSEPSTSEQLGQRIIASGGDKIFIGDNMPLLIETMVQQGELRVGRDGRLEASDGKGGPRHYVTRDIAASPDILALLPKIDGALLKYILTTDAGVSTCYYQHDPDIEETHGGRLIDRLRKLDLVSVSQSAGGKDNTGRSCSVTVTVQLTDTFSDLQGYFYAVLALTIGRSPNEH